MDNTQNDWKSKLTPEQYRIMREDGTEPAFTGKYVSEHSKGMYKCAACGAELFSSDAKFDSGTGWPSFTEPANLEHVELRDDSSVGTLLRDGFEGQVHRTEVICKNCGSHLGHVFDDGPAEKGGKRYCINSVCLELEKKD
jgi:peptide-methionine (R)-S-oxide reductase